MIGYPSVEKIIELNLLALMLLKAKKADSPKVLSETKIREVLRNCEQTKGDTYDKAVILMKGIIQKHAFASGNRRTALLATTYFLTLNNAKSNIADNPDNAKTMTGIREGYYTDEEIKEWIQHGKINAFKR
ncbi:MAG: Fic family protein [Candidatus Diapherotrites archaeon]